MIYHRCPLPDIHKPSVCPRSILLPRYRAAYVPKLLRLHWPFVRAGSGKVRDIPVRHHDARLLMHAFKLHVPVTSVSLCSFSYSILSKCPYSLLAKQLTISFHHLRAGRLEKLRRRTADPAVFAYSNPVIRKQLHTSYAKRFKLLRNQFELSIIHIPDDRYPMRISAPACLRRLRFSRIILLSCPVYFLCCLLSNSL